MCHKALCANYGILSHFFPRAVGLRKQGGYFKSSQAHLLLFSEETKVPDHKFQCYISGTYGLGDQRESTWRVHPSKQLPKQTTEKEAGRKTYPVSNILPFPRRDPISI